MEKELIQIRIQFWINLWEDLISNFLKKSYGLTLYSPHILVDDIITEIEENSFKNSDNKKYFYSKLCYYIDNDEIIKNKFYSSFKILRTIFNTEKNNYILEVSKSIKNEFEKGLYFNSLLNQLTESITKDEKITLEYINSINYCTQNIIVELLKKGYVLDDIKNFAKNIFDQYSIQKTQNIDFLSTKFPHPFESDNYVENDKFNREKFNSDIINFLNKLNINNRIETLSYYYYKEKEKVKYIFSVEGLKGNIEIEIGNVVFYSLDKKRFIDEKHEDLDQEDLQRKLDNKEKFIQAAVEVDYLLPKSSLTTAINELESILDVISCYFKKATEIEINTSNYVIVQNGKRIFSSWGKNRKDMFFKFRNSLNLNEYEENFKELSDISFLWNKKELNKKAKSKLINAVHWYSKAEQSVKQEDKMLNYWIAIENLFNLEFDIKNDVLKNSKNNKVQLIEEIISSVQIFSFVYDYGWELYHHYSNHVNIFSNHKNNKISKEIIDKAQLDPKIGEKIYLENFINSLDDIIKCETDLFLIQKIENLIKFYNDPLFSKKVIIEQIKLIEEDILMIYRFRNLIVHNAHFDNTLLPYFVWKIRNYSGNLIRNLINDFDGNDVEMSSLMIRVFLKKEKFMNDLEYGKVDLFEK